ncbi:DUF1254 domain-containing protein [Mycobacterium sp. OTB74]|uniref:DUF1254 domain-containing protein n=1 Tax=Mycobacterium sp. OTB74 TaxID=1853452 RepID=UPI002475B78A|nr:DUF1254 domain-containing protein [Mycobacterium sp. OTB74]
MVAAAVSGCSPSPSDKSSAGPLSADAAKAIALDAYTYGYALVTTEMTRRVMTNVEKVDGSRAPMGQLMRMREYPNAAFRDVTAPNADTLYTNGFIDVKDEPWVLSLPEAADRYYLFPMLDGYTNVFEVPGKRTTGTGPQTYAITGPNWKGTLPPGVTEYRSPTSTVWLLGRIYCTGTPEDYAAVHKMQDAISLAPLSSYGKPYTPPAGKVDPTIDMKTPVRDQVNNLSVEDYFNLMATLMKDNPPTPADQPAVDKMAKIGLVPGQKFDINKYGADVAAALKSVPKEGFDKIMAHFKSFDSVNGWRFTTKTGQYGTDYLQRAVITAIGLGANRPQDAVYPTSEVDASGQPYSGANKYTVHFDKDQLPPANGFWSLTMYDEGFFFVDNPLNRYNLSQRNAFVTNPDGSVDLYLQHDNPGPGHEANWLPAPSGKFNLMLRLYWPKETPPSIIDGTWKPPVVSKTA